MSAYIQDMRVGDDYKFSIVRQGLDTLPLDITGYKFWITLKRSFDDLDADAVLQFSVTAGDNAGDDLLNGLCIVHIPASITKDVPVGKYFWDIQESALGGQITTVLPPLADYKDKINVYPEVTRAI
jgi:hypothetical protein